MNQQQVESGPEQVRKALGVVHFVCRSLASILEVPLHSWETMGERYFGPQTAAAILCMFLYTAFWRGVDVTPILGLMIVYVVLCGLARLRIAARLRGGGSRVHSYSNGVPRIMRLARGLSEETVRRLVEPLGCFIIGALVLGASEPLGTLLMLCSFGLFATVNLAAGFDRTRALDLHDAYLDQCNTAERFHEMHGQ